jgi:ATP-binding cassette subfamily C protein CydD
VKKTVYGSSRTAEPAAAALLLLEQTDRVEPYHRAYVPARLALGPAFLLCLVVLAPVSWSLALFLLFAGVVIPFNLTVLGRFAESVSRRQISETTALSAYFLDRLQGLDDLRTLGAGERETSRVASSARELAQRTNGVLRAGFLSTGVIELIVTFALALVATGVGLTLLRYASFPGLPADLSLGTGLFLLVAAPVCFQPLRMFAAAHHARADAVAAAGPMAALLEASPVVAEAFPGPTVQLADVTVHYPGRHEPALSAVTFALQPGRFTAVTGPSGGGKTTLLSVVAGQLAADTGTVSGTGGSTAWIGQRPYLFPGTVAENIALGRPGATDEDVRSAARQAGLTLDVTRALGERGHGVSGGEAQRIAIARALLADADLLILDEPTAHLDAATEAEVLRSLLTATRGRTVLAATHSEALLAAADEVRVVDGGRLLDRARV